MYLANSKHTIDHFEDYYGKRFKRKIIAAINFAISKNNAILLAHNVKNIYSESGHTFEFYVFYNINLFWEYFQTLSINNRQFYNVFYTKQRSLYLDIDCYETNIYLNYNFIKNELIDGFRQIKQIKKNWKESLKYNDNWEKNFYIYSSIRKDKISLHILNPEIVLDDLTVYESVCTSLKSTTMNKIFKYIDIINGTIQLYRLPFCLKREKNSLFKINL